MAFFFLSICRWLRPAALGLLLAGLAARPALAQRGQVGAHDPSTVVKEGGKYWTFTTGQGITSLYSTDLVSWTAGPRPVFQNNGFPSWITSKVPGFTGNFWAPECFFMNGQYYLYYSCSTFGSKVSAIGLATNATLDPTSPSYQWVDQGEVISTNASSAVNAIDPAIFRDDATGRLWLSYGSFFGGLRITELSATTGKVLNASNQTAVANADPEAACLTKNGSYYYLFFNRGACCRGANSTYYIMVGRSTSPTGPFLDQQGVSVNSGGGTLVLNVSGRYVGPGHAGILTEGGVQYFSHHYYDGEDSGAPKLGLAKLTWSAAGWPVVSRDWLPAGAYTFANRQTNQVWGTTNCVDAAGQAVVQGAPAGLACQQWNLVPQGDGIYKITSAQGNRPVSQAACSPNNGTGLQLGNPNGSCQEFTLTRASDGSYVLAAGFGNRVVEVPNCSATAGTQLALYDYLGNNCQKWSITTGGALAATQARGLTGVSLYPVPAPAGRFTVELGSQLAAEATTVEVLNLQGQVVYRRAFEAGTRQLLVAAELGAGVYLVRVSRAAGSFAQKITIL